MESTRGNINQIKQDEKRMVDEEEKKEKGEVSHATTHVLPKRRVRFVDTTPSPSLRGAGFSPPEVVESEVSISRSMVDDTYTLGSNDLLPSSIPTPDFPCSEEDELPGSIGWAAANGRPRHVSFDASTSAPTTTSASTPNTKTNIDDIAINIINNNDTSASASSNMPPSHLAPTLESTFNDALPPIPPRKHKSVEYVDSPDFSFSGQQYQRGLTDEELTSRLQPPSLELHTRTPSPSAIVTFSSRVKGSSVLFAPPQTRQLSNATISDTTVSPIDFTHHGTRNNAAYENARLGASSAFSLPPSAYNSTNSSRRQSRASSTSSTTSPYVPPSALSNPSSLGPSTATPAPLPPINLLPPTLPSRELSALRNSDGVGYDARERFDFDDYDDDDGDDDFEMGTGGSRLRVGAGVTHGIHELPPHRYSISTASATPTFDRPSVSQLPLYTRILRIFLIGVGVVRYTSTTDRPDSKDHFNNMQEPLPESSIDDQHAPPTAVRRSGNDSFTSNLSATFHSWWFRFRSYLYPLIVFLFILANSFFVSVSRNSITGDTDSRSYNNWINLIAEFCVNTAPLLSWVGAFYMVGLDDARAFLVFFEQLSNLEAYNYRILRNYIVGSCIAGLVLMATTNLTSMNAYPDGQADSSFFTLLNVGLFVLLNYLITTFVICALASLICIFHYYSLKIFQEQLYSQGLTVQEAIKEHIVLMRLQRESEKYLQYIIFPPLVLYISGALLAGYNMLSSRVYSNISATMFQLVLAFATLMIPLVSGAQITAICADLARLATNLDLTSNLLERSSLIQQLVLLPGNAFHVFRIKISFSLLAKLSYVGIGCTIVIARGATITTPSN